jgi:hypothetical protein
MKTKMNLNDIDLWNKIIYDLNGSCDSLERQLINHDAEELRDYMPFLNYLDNEIFLCDGCGWWCELSEMTDSELCNSCDDGE